MESKNINRKLEEREAAILSALITEYITTGRPVGSRSFVQKYSFSISPATMRNIMSDLEGAGFLMQPYTSAGRIPTDLGYRYYLDMLLEKYDFAAGSNVNISNDVLNRELQLNKIFSSITKMLSHASSYAGIILTPLVDFAVVKRIELISLENQEILVVVVTRTGMILTKKVVLSDMITQDQLYSFSKFLTSEVCGYSLDEIKKNKLQELRNINVVDFARDVAIDIVELFLNNLDKSELHIDGIENLLKIPEMIEPERLNSLLSIIEEKNILRKIFESALNIDGIVTLIGDEIEKEEVNGCSVVITTYKIGNKRVGAIGVLGPTRMDYEKIIPLVDYTGKIVSKLLTKMSK